MKKSTCVLLILLTMAFTAFAQQVTVTGTVIDRGGSPLMGATVVEVGTTNGVVTDINGKFTIRVASGDAQLTIAYLGYETMTLAANSPLLSQNIVLQELATSVGDVVVIGYGTVRKEDLTGSVSVIKADDINRGSVVSTDELLKAKVPGLLMIPGDGGPNSKSTIRIRGAASLKASNDPLIVIDGLPISGGAAEGMSNPLASINPNDVESFSVLKDASATAIYGSRASNGVILITTKKGRGGNVPTISYNSNYYIKSNIKTIETMNAREYREFMLDYYPENTTGGTTVRSLIGDANTDWQDLVYRNAFGMDHNLSVYGNVNKMLPYRVSFGYTSEDATLKNTDFQRSTLDVSLSPKLFDDHLSITMNAKGVYNENNFADGGVVGAAAFFDPTQSPYFYKADGTIDYDKANGYFNWYGGGSPNTQAGNSPLSLLYENYNRNYVKRFLGNVQLDYKLHWLPDLRFNLNLGLDVTSTAARQGAKPGSFMALKDTASPGNGRRTHQLRIRRDKTLEFYMAYAKELNKHRFDVMGGYSWQHFYLSDKDKTILNVTETVYNDAPRNAREYYLISLFGRANYAFDNRFLFTFTLRGDASSRFHKDNRWGLFPSAALAWNIKNEKFLKEVSALSELKLRLGYGSTGQQDIGEDYYSYLARYVVQSNPVTTYNLGDAFYSTMQPLAYNPGLKWETTDTYNIGVDYGFLNGRISGSLDFYFRKTKDLLNTIPTSLGTNFSNTVISNIGNMENKGVELSINAIPVQTKDWNWNVNFNITWQKTKITKLLASDEAGYFVESEKIGFGTGGFLQMHQVGSAPNTFYTYQQVYDRKGSPIQNALVDRDKNGAITENDRYNTKKSPMPDYFFGLSSSVSYRNWDLGFNSHASFGNYVFNSFYSEHSMAEGSYLNLGYLTNMAKTVRKSGFRTANTTEQYYSDMFLENASFFKMDDITLGYTFKNIGKSRLNIRTAFSVQNVFTITNYSGLDPEIGNGIDGNIWPRPRTFTFRLNINF